MRIFRSALPLLLPILLPYPVQLPTLPPLATLPPMPQYGGPLKDVAYNIPVQLGMNVDTDPAAANHLTLVPYDQIKSYRRPQIH